MHELEEGGFFKTGPKFQKKGVEKVIEDGDLKIIEKRWRTSRVS